MAVPPEGDGGTAMGIFLKGLPNTDYSKLFQSKCKV